MVYVEPVCSVSNLCGLCLPCMAYVDDVNKYALLCYVVCRLCEPV
jgi:hypothetical protein